MVHPYRSFVKSEFWYGKCCLNSFVFIGIKGLKCDILHVENKRLRYINGGIRVTRKASDINELKGGLISLVNSITYMFLSVSY
jgi:hypothetical protein